MWPEPETVSAPLLTVIWLLTVKLPPAVIVTVMGLETVSAELTVIGLVLVESPMESESMPMSLVKSLVLIAMALLSLVLPKTMLLPAVLVVRAKLLPLSVAPLKSMASALTVSLLVPAATVLFKVSLLVPVLMDSGASSVMGASKIRSVLLEVTVPRILTLALALLWRISEARKSRTPVPVLMWSRRREPGV